MGSTADPGGPLGRARAALLEARASQAQKDTPGARAEVKAALAHLDYLLDTLPLSKDNPPPTPGGPGDQPPGPPVPLFAVGGEHWSLEDELLGGGECATTQKDTDSEDV